MTYSEVEAAVSPRTHHLPAAALAAVSVALLIAAPELAGDTGLLGAVALVQLAFVAAWAVATGTGGALGTAIVGVLAAAGADAALVLPDRPRLGGLLAVLGPAFLVVVLAQMFRRRREDMVAALSGGVLLVCAVSSLAVLLLLGRSEPAGLATSALLAVGAALVVGHLVDLVLPRPQLAPEVPRGLVGLLLAVAAGAAVGFARRGTGDLVDSVSAVTFGAVLGAVAALVAVAASYVAAETDPDGGRGRAAALWVVQALLPIAACAPVALGLQTAL
ncbi:hypothetical protein [Geodermatophilus sp. URMC 64]